LKYESATYSETVTQQVHQLLEEQETLVGVSVDVLWSSDGQFDDEPGSKFDLCLHFSLWSSSSLVGNANLA
jgi:hypothetical protein